MFKPSRNLIFVAAAAMVVPSVAIAQDDVTDQANRVAAEARELARETNELTNSVAQQAADRDGTTETRTDDRDDDDGDSGNWGLLGLLGLAGLLGLKRREDHRDRHVHVDHDRDRGARL